MVVNFTPRFSIEQIFAKLHDPTANNRDELNEYGRDLAYMVLPRHKWDTYEYRQLYAIGGESSCLDLWDRDLKRRIILKVAKPEFSLVGQRNISEISKIKKNVYYLKEVKERFIRGGHLQAYLHKKIASHIGILPEIYSAYRSPFVALEIEFAHGVPLLAWCNTPNIVDGKPYGKRKNFEQLFSVFYRLVALTHYLHLLGVVHRDIKPDNILIQTRGNTDYICLLDLTLSKPENNSQTKCDYLTITGGRIRSGIYSSPVCQVDFSQAGRQCDILSLFRTFWTMCSGFEVEKVDQIEMGHLPQDGFLGLYAKACWHNSERYRECGEVLDDLDNYAGSRRLNIETLKVPTFQSACDDLAKSPTNVIWDDGTKDDETDEHKLVPLKVNRLVAQFLKMMNCVKNKDFGP